MDEFKAGDRVQYKSTGPVMANRERNGVVRGVTLDGWILVDFDDGGQIDVRCDSIFLKRLDVAA